MSEHVFKVTKEQLAILVGNAAVKELQVSGVPPPFEADVRFETDFDNDDIWAIVNIKDGSDA